jgi:oligopeptide/dipeptide ABC transporter ATP-binding protein
VDEATLMSDHIVDLQDVSLFLPTDQGEAQLLDGVSLTLSRGESLAIVGESGSGKSMTLRTISRLLPGGARTTGEVVVNGRRVDQLRGAKLRAMRRSEIATVFQDPRSAINPIQRVEDFMLEAVRDARGDVRGSRAAAVHLLRRMGVTDPERRMRQYPFELSGGLLQRVMIASVLLAGPDVILADEPTTALDVTTQSDVLAITDDLRRERGVALLFVTHDLDLAMAICDRVMVLYAGRVLEVATAADLREGAQHPYSRGLLASRPPLDRRLESLEVIDGVPMSATEVGPGCPFHDRCPVRLDVCRSVMPEPVGDVRHWVRCHRVEQEPVRSSALMWEGDR